MQRAHPYSKIVIVFNPNSTGDSPAMAKQFYKEVKKALPSVPVEVKETKRAGHAEELAYNAATSHKNTVVVSVSGDGGYNEVVNGAMRATDEKKGTPICALLPGGNANDHHTNVSKRPLIEALLDHEITNIDVLQIRAGKNLRYAHSYAGIGLTSVIGKELNKHSLNTVKEMLLSAKAYKDLEPLTVKSDGKDITFYSILAATIPNMAKHLTLAKNNSLKDGKFNLLIWRQANKLRLSATILKAAIGLRIPHKKVSSFSFNSANKLSMQLDGEILDIPKNTDCTISVAQKGLRTIR